MLLLIKREIRFQLINVNLFKILILLFDLKNFIIFFAKYFDLIGEKRGDRRRVHRYLYKDIRERDGKNLSGSRIVQQSES